MIKISDALQDIIPNNSFLEFGMSERLLNLSQLAKFLQPLVEARLQKEVQPSAIVMSLSRYQKSVANNAVKKQAFQISHLSAFSNVCTWTFAISPTIHDRVSTLHHTIREHDGFFAMTETGHELTIFTEHDQASLVEELIPEPEKYKNTDVACLDVRFAESFMQSPGLLFALLQKITLQNINLIEITSTYTGFSFYLEKKDLKTAFETLHDSFLG